MVIFQYNLYIFVWIQHGCLTNTVYAMDPNNSVIKRLWCVYIYIYIYIYIYVFIVIFFNPFTSSGLCYHNSLEWYISNSRVSG